MNNSPSLRQRHTRLHRWVGLLLGWLLYAIFLTGTLSFFQEEITEWMTPERHSAQPTPETPLKAIEQLQQLAPQAHQWNISLPSPRQNALTVHWLNPGQMPGKGAGQSLALNVATGEPLAVRETRGGNFLYRFHFELTGIPYLWGRWIVGLAALLMLVALVTGVIIHKKIFSDFFTFRPAAGQRSWLDMHCATAVFALPFHLMITYSGLVLLMLMLMPWGIQAAYQGNVQHYMSEMGLRAGSRPFERPQSSEFKAAALTPLAPLLTQANQRWPRGISSIQINNPNTEHAVIELRERGANSLLNRAQPERLRFNGVTGAALDSPSAPELNGALAVYNVLTSLHMLRFAEYDMRWLFFFSGLLGTGMIATGLVFWSRKRLHHDGRHRGYRLVEILNVGVLVGLPIAIASYFWANRLLAWDSPERAAHEIQYFLLAWGGCLLHAMLRNYRQAWTEQLTMAALLFISLPIFNFSLPDSHLLTTLVHGQWPLAVMDMSLLIVGGLCALASRTLVAAPHPQPEED